MSANDDFIIGAGSQEFDEVLEELNRREASEQAARERAAQLNAHSARSVKHKAGVGKFIIPKENTWAAHRVLVMDPNLGLHFSHQKHPYFDHIIAENSSLSDMYDPGSRKYDGYDSLRENIAIVRNYVMSEFFPDGSVDADDEQKLRHMAQIAHFIGDGLSNDKLFSNPLKPKISVARANLPGTGAQYIYEQLLKRQNYNSWISPVTGALAFITGGAGHNWDLPPMEYSPFSDAALQAAPPQERKARYSEEDLAALYESAVKDNRAPHDIDQQNMDDIHLQTINHVADDLTHASSMYHGVDSLQEPTKRESVEIAKEILRKLKVKLGNALIVNGLTPFPAENSAILDALKGVVQVYEFNLNKLMSMDKSTMENPAIVKTNDAIGKMGYIAKVEALRIAQRSDNPQQAEAIYSQISQMPAHWQNPPEQYIGELVGQIEDGLNMVLTRLEHLAEPDPAMENWMGRLNHQAIGTIDPEFESKDDRDIKAMGDDDYYRQVNAQRQQQQAMRAARQKQQLERDAMNKSLSGAPKKDMSALIGSQDIACMRSQMKTDDNAETVKAGNQARRQAVMAKERARREMQRQQQVKVKENLDRLKQQDDTVQAPMMRKNSNAMLR